MSIGSYIENISKRYALGNATEHTFRGDLQSLVEELVPEVAATNEPKRIECGAPDYVITRKDIPVGYIEAKDIGEDLKGAKIKEQRDRYKDALDNLIFTDYLDFHLYRSGQLKITVRIAEVKNGKIVSIPENFDEFTSLIKEFAAYRGQTIKSSKTLAEMMAEKAKMLAFIINNALLSDEESEANSTLNDQMSAFKQVLIHDLDAKAFADVYAQTIAYGMFAARLHDPSLETFTRREAAELIPKTNPFLRKLFNNIATDIDERIEWIVDALADVFRAADIKAILKDFGKSTQTHDPIMHFYETFLAEYDPKLRKSRGVYYTPEPVVDFIVRAVDDILKTEFGLPMGLADTSKTKIKLKTTVKDERTKSGYKEEEKEVHKVQILDPATGTGTFLAQVIKQVHKSFEGQEGIWSNYVDEHLVPRLNGFELLMASYAMAHLKLDLLLSETGYTSDKANRFRVYLTNALEEFHPETGMLWTRWLSDEANEANHIKRDTPVMVVMGNPPYSVSSSNKSKWIEDLTADYKKDLNERNIQPLSDDYIKFIRFGQHFIDKNGEGILAYITNHSFIDGSIHRRMRSNLLTSFDKIYVLDLHGNALRKEICTDGTPDENVFDIMQGVSISIFVKTNRGQPKTCSVFHSDIRGTRTAKYASLEDETITSMSWKEINPANPDFFFVAKDFAGTELYKAGFVMNELFDVSSNGIKTHRDGLVIDIDKATLQERMRTFYDSANSDPHVRTRFDLKDNRDWNLATARQSGRFDANKIEQLDYRPFDSRVIYFDKSLIDFARQNVMKNFSGHENLGLLCNRQIKSETIAHFLITKSLSDFHVLETANASVSTFPLYLYGDSDKPRLDGKADRLPNFNSEIVDEIAAAIGLTFTNEKEDTEGTFAPIDILDYIYAVLHSPNYRDKYKEFLKIDFPRVPYPKDVTTFWQLVKRGGELRLIHLLESPKLNQFITGYPVGGGNQVTKIEKRGDNVFINQVQHFSGVPSTAWNFYIGGYQPAQKWLKDRKGRQLSFDDIQHYQKIIVALTETDRLMKEIDKIDFID